MVEPGRNRWSQSSLELLLMGRRCKHILLFISKRLFRIAVFTKVLRQAWLVFSKKKERNSSAGPLSAAASCQLRLPYTRQLHYIWRRQQRRRWQQQQLAVGRSFGVRTDFHFWAPLLTLIYHVFLVRTNAGHFYSDFVPPAISVAQLWRNYGCRHSSVNSSAPSILLPRVWDPSTPSTLFQFILFKLYICHLNWNEKRTELNKKRPRLAHFLKKFPNDEKQFSTLTKVTIDCFLNLPLGNVKISNTHLSTS